MPLPTAAPERQLMHRRSIDVQIDARGSGLWEAVLPTAVVQAFAGGVLGNCGDKPGSPQPFQLDRCQALRLDGLAVQAYYPRWYREPASASSGAGAAIPVVNQKARASS